MANYALNGLKLSSRREGARLLVKHSERAWASPWLRRDRCRQRWGAGPEGGSVLLRFAHAQSSLPRGRKASHEARLLAGPCPLGAGHLWTHVTSDMAAARDCRPWQPHSDGTRGSWTQGRLRWTLPPWLLAAEVAEGLGPPWSCGPKKAGADNLRPGRSLAGHVAAGVWAWGCSWEGRRRVVDGCWPWTQWLSAGFPRFSRRAAVGLHPAPSPDGDETKSTSVSSGESRGPSVSLGHWEALKDPALDAEPFALQRDSDS